MKNVWFFRSGIKQWKETQDSLYVFHKSISNDYALEVKENWEDFYREKQKTPFRTCLVPKADLDMFLLKAFQALKGDIKASWIEVPKALEPKKESL